MNDTNTTGEDFEKEEREMQYGGWEGCWPGDGSGLSDFDDYNQNEGGDY